MRHLSGLSWGHTLHSIFGQAEQRLLQRLIQVPARMQIDICRAFGMHGSAYMCMGMATVHARCAHTCP